ncbi:hypothetical protein [Pseudosporangium ferrugineum]|uniref:Uncharacterized protein n=1 Tax=Pseudosporangium ferrugineum TaxID=439699 RepID=A0A2T0S4H2_9ACTN|nr:hypothetical protein [Pseudosporangium ferrugineum]PRY28306.1 hypothetical protein CLV70_10898 [Pseudosporangium ferrugineum]
MSTAGAADPPGVLASLGTGLRLIAGWFSVVIGVLNLLAELDSPPEAGYLLFHGVLVAGGALLIGLPGWVRPTGCLAAAGAAVAGMVLAALPASRPACCLTSFAERHGYPFSVVARDAGRAWQVDGARLLADLLFWGYAGLFALMLVVLVRRAGKGGP